MKSCLLLRFLLNWRNACNMKLWNIRRSSENGKCAFSELTFACWPQNGSLGKQRWRSMKERPRFQVLVVISNFSCVLHRFGVISSFFWTGSDIIAVWHQDGGLGTQRWRTLNKRATSIVHKWSVTCNFLRILHHFWVNSMFRLQWDFPILGQVSRVFWPPQPQIWKCLTRNSYPLKFLT